MKLNDNDLLNNLLNDQPNKDKQIQFEVQLENSQNEEVNIGEEDIFT